VTTALIIGSGPAAAGAALALSRRRDLKITVIDMGLSLETERQQNVDLLASSDPCQWNAPLVESISKQPVDSGSRGIAEKRLYGSDYPYRNIGQLDGLTATANATTSLITAAYGGFSTIWGSQVMPFTAPTFESWPFSAEAIRPHYEAILRQIPFAGEEDDLADIFPLMGQPAPLPQLSLRSRWVLDAYERHRPVLNGGGITIGKARLAFDASNCVRCGMCMTGCPYGLIYSAAQTFEALERSNQVSRHSGLLALKVEEKADRALVVAKQLATGRMREFEADRIYIACGAISSTRLVANSLALWDIELPILESQQFILPMLSLHPTPDPRLEPDFTLNQFNMIVAPDGSSVDISQLHFYAFNSAFTDALPSLLRRQAAEKAQVHLLRRLTVALGFLPSWRSPRLVIRARPNANVAHAPDLHISRETAPAGRNQMLRTVLTKLSRAARHLDLYPVLPMMQLAAGGKSYHFGGTFPHTNGGSAALGSDRLGRVGPWRRVHLVDASVFPNVPAMTFTLTIMANAHRIASETLELPS
jgi:choline dehydrogenase-like flavoprotein